jgi:OFA family oxalate/formate antiporter-like MFS transporter
MSNDTASAVPAVKNRGWSVTLAGLGINLALGVLYTWSVISKGVPEEWHWTETDKSLPYAVACLVFCLIMVPAGRMQDRMGPRIVATIGGLLVGIGLIVASRTTSPMGYILGFGVLAGAGFGFGYASATPPAVKWFPASKTGLIAGLVVSGFGLASVYAAPLAKWLTGAYGLPTMVISFGIGFLIVVTLLAQRLTAPPAGYVPAGSPAAPTGAAALRKADFTPVEMLKTPQFWALWFIYACGAGAGLMIIGKLAKIGQDQAGLSLGFVLVAVLALGNGGGRIVAGILFDKIGRKAALLLFFGLQTVCILLLSRTSEGSFLAQTPVLALLSALIGAGYGANLSLFPSITKDFYGLKNFGVNYGLIFTAWGLGGFMLALLAGKVYDKTHAFTFAYYCSAGLLVTALIVTLLVKPPRARAA